jgi:hypothetical protein
MANSLSPNLPWALANPKWAAALNAVLAVPLVSGQAISNIILPATTPTVVYHSLDQIPNGWFLIDNTANAVIWRTQPFNSKSITLEASAKTTISIWIY